jgi:hypothetical protein
MKTKDFTSVLTSMPQLLLLGMALQYTGRRMLSSHTSSLLSKWHQESGSC